MKKYLIAFILLLFASTAFANPFLLPMSGGVAGCSEAVGETGDGDTLSETVGGVGSLLAYPVTTADCDGTNITINAKIYYLLNGDAYKGRIGIYSNKSNYSGTADGPDSLLWGSPDYRDTSAESPWYKWYSWSTTADTAPNTKYWIVYQGQIVSQGIRSTTGSSGRGGWRHTGSWTDGEGLPGTFPSAEPSATFSTYIPHVNISF
jgi:hypothetical protein